MATDNYPQPIFNEQQLLIYDFRYGLNKHAQIYSSFNNRGEYKCDLPHRNCNNLLKVTVVFDDSGKRIIVFKI